MSDKIFMKEITLPIVETGENETYSFVQTDADLDTAGDAADAKAVGDELTNLKQDLQEFPNGNYPNMTAGNADQLVSTVTSDDDTPYNFRTTAGSADVGDRAYVDAIVGGTLSLNQLVKSFTDAKTINGVTFTANGGAITVSGTATSNAAYPLHTVPLYANHVYFLNGCPYGGRNGSINRYALYMNETNPQLFDVGTGSMQKQTADTTGALYFIVYSGQTVDFTFIPQLFDVTKTFGTTIADYVYGLETATAGAGVAWLKANAPKIFDGGYIPFNAGTLQSVVGLSEKRNTGLNQWDEETEIGDIDGVTGAFKTGNYLRTKNYIPVLPNTTYYFDIPSAVFFYEYDANKDVIMNGNYAYHYKATSGTVTTGANTHYITFRNDISNASQTYHYDICINLHWDGEKDGTYEPYTLHTYAFDPTVELRGVPKLKDGKMYFDGDRYLPDGTVQRRCREVLYDGTNYVFTGAWGATANGFAVYTYVSDLKKTGDTAYCISDRFVCNVDGYTRMPVGTFGGTSGASETLTFILPSTVTTLAQANEWLRQNQFSIVYETRTSTTETATPYNPVEIVNDFGTEKFITTSLVPVGHETRYAPNLRAKLEMAPESPDGDGLYIVQQSSGENTYIPLASSATIQDILDRLTALENA